MLLSINLNAEDVNGVTPLGQFDVAQYQFEC